MSQLGHTAGGLPHPPQKFVWLDCPQLHVHAFSAARSFARVSFCFLLLCADVVTLRTVFWVLFTVATVLFTLFSVFVRLLSGILPPPLNSYYNYTSFANRLSMLVFGLNVSFL